MNQYIKKITQIVAVAAVLAFGAGLVAVPSAGAIGVNDGAGAAKGNDQTNCLLGSETGCAGRPGLIKTITNILLFVIGAIAVIMIVIGGIRYTVSGGDSAAVTSAKNTILYGVVGVIIAILAYAIVNFVVGSFVR